MLPGPVFRFELLMAARRGTLYATRAVYAIVLLLIIWGIHTSWSASYEGEIPVRMLRWFALSALAGLAVGQELLVLLLTPTLVAGVIADEKRRKTLHYLLASRLTGPEIVLGKLLARMLYLGVLLGVSLPVMSMLVFFGGLEPTLVLLIAAGLFSTAWFLGALSIWVSTIARRPRDTLFITFGLEALWLVVPPSIQTSFVTGWMASDTLTWLMEWVGASSPVYVTRNLVWSLVAAAPVASWAQSLGWMIGLQAGAGVVLAALAAIQVRPIFKRQEGRIAQPRGVRAMLARRRTRAHPLLGDRPMLWKELHTGGARGFARFMGWMLTLILGGLLLYHGVQHALWAYLEMREQGYWVVDLRTTQHSRLEFFYFLQSMIPVIYVFATVAIAGAAAASITSEHEDDTWVSLTTTDLTGREIVRAKLCGALWRARRLGGLVLLFVVAAIGVGSLHYLTLPCLALALAVYGWFAAALGVWISMYLRSTWRAQFLTVAMLLLINVTGQGILNMFWQRGFVPQVWPGFTPYEVHKLIMNPGFFGMLAAATRPQLTGTSLIADAPAWLAIFSVVSVVSYAGLAWLLTKAAIARFEIAAGRARRSVEPADPPKVAGRQDSSVDDDPETAAAVEPVACPSTSRT
jgi:ABC-type transport system involved in multi-copper enzyme maturation permease subunit